MRTILIGALAATLVGCSRQPVMVSCTDANGFACLERRAGPPIKLASFRINSTATYSKTASTWNTEKSSFTHARRGPRLASRTAKPTGISAKAETPASRILLQSDSSKGRPEFACSAAAADSKTTRANIAESHSTVGVTNGNARPIEAQVAAATALAECITVATAIPPSDMKLNNGDKSSRRETSVPGNGEKNAPAPADVADVLVAVLMARPEIKSVSDLTGKNIAIDSRHSASNGSVRTAIVAAGATMVELSEGQTTAINRLVSGEVPAAVLALVSADAAKKFPEIVGFRIFHIPLSPRSLNARP